MRTFFLSTCAFVLFGCGGKVVVDRAGSGGAGGSDAPTSSTTTSSSSSSSVTSVSSTTTSVVSSSSGIMPCVVPFPGIEAPCEEEGQVCGVPLACCAGTAICQQGFWTFQGLDCGSACGGPCGPNDFACEPSAVCIAYIGKTTIYQCVPDPCPDSDLACSCADPVCAKAGMFCNNIQDGDKVLCDCIGDC